MALSKGRRQGRSLRKTNTIKPKSAEQGMLINQDALIDYLNAIKDAIDSSSDGDTLQAALAAVSASIPSKLRLR